MRYHLPLASLADVLVQPISSTSVFAGVQTDVNRVWVANTGDGCTESKTAVCLAGVNPCSVVSFTFSNFIAGTKFWFEDCGTNDFALYMNGTRFGGARFSPYDHKAECGLEVQWLFQQGQ
ncbi:hypothetical protein LTS10_006299 [Elasticomyces elasticus]|nr:hypothetical protein LTS10_006299 [Elasticomyces elasticus]